MNLRLVRTGDGFESARMPRPDNKFKDIEVGRGNVRMARMPRFDEEFVEDSQKDGEDIDGRRGI